MSTSGSVSSRSSFDSDAGSTSGRSSGGRHDSHPSQQSDLNDLSRRPLPRLPPRVSPTSHSGQMLAAILRDRALPRPQPYPEDRAEDSRRAAALDRKRRLTNTAQEEGRRRTISGGFHDRGFPSTTIAYRTDGPSTSYPSRHTSSDAPRPPPEVIDLTASTPSPEPQTSTDSRLRRTSSSNSSRRYVVPKWQPDSEVTECPICHRPFTWMFRRHHCRKCGRVVCNDCSPHRITIPRQFIVHPPGPDLLGSPGSPVSRRSDSVDLTGDDDANEDDEENPFQSLSDSNRHVPSPQLEGGEKVRLCNPCVPDPQPDPLPNYPPVGHGAGVHEVVWNPGIRHAGESGVVSDPMLSLYSSSATESSVMPARAPTNHHQYQRSTGSIQPGFGDSGLPWVGPQRGPTPPSRYRLHGSPISPDGQTVSSSSRDYLPNTGRSSSHMPRTSYSGSRQPRDEALGASDFSGGRIDRPPRSVQQLLGHSSRPRLNESDICPICRRALPPRGADGDESVREAHIIDCIRARDPSYHGEAGSGGPSHARLHMLTFIATEKDCVAQDGNTQECSICMVEYDVGDELARLECLCKFHKECIVEWLGRKEECPVHKLITG